METDRLRQFCVIADSGSLTKAAEILNISLGGLSKSMKVLEEEMGFALFLPAGRGLVISDFGLALYVKAKGVLQAVANLTTHDESQRAAFQVGVLEVFATHFMGMLIAQKFAGQRVTVIEGQPGQLEAMLLNKQLDCAITYLPYPQAGLDIVALGRFELKAYLKNGFFVTGADEEVPFIVPPTGFSGDPLGIKERDGWPEHTQKRNRFHQVNMLSTALDMARQGLGAVYMPDFVARIHNVTQRKEFQLVPLERAAKIKRSFRKVYLIKRSGILESPEFKSLAAGIRDLL